jgi:hypothetical protein
LFRSVTLAAQKKIATKVRITPPKETGKMAQTRLIYVNGCLRPLLDSLNSTF